MIIYVTGSHSHKLTAGKLRKTFGEVDASVYILMVIEFLLQVAESSVEIYLAFFHITPHLVLIDVFWNFIIADARVFLL